MQKQVISRQRVLDHGEVYTHEREVEAMLNLVADESYRLDSKFLEPSCGHGNFLVAVLKRKLPKKLFVSSQETLIALSSIYGIELLKDNVLLARGRLYYMVLKSGSLDTKEKKEQAKAILRKNIVWGDALEMRCADKRHQVISFYNWQYIDGFMVADKGNSMEKYAKNYTQPSLGLWGG